MPCAHLNRSNPVSLQSLFPLRADSAVHGVGPGQDRPDGKPVQHAEQAKAVVCIKVSHEDDVQASVASWQQSGQPLRCHVAVRPTVDEHLPPRRGDDQGAVSLPNVQEMNVQQAIGAIRYPQPKKHRCCDQYCGGGDGVSRVRQGPSHVRPQPLSGVPEHTVAQQVNYPLHEAGDRGAQAPQPVWLRRKQGRPERSVPTQQQGQVYLFCVDRPRRECRDHADDPRCRSRGDPAQQHA